MKAYEIEEKTKTKYYVNELDVNSKRLYAVFASKKDAEDFIREQNVIAQFKQDIKDGKIKGQDLTF